MNKTFCTIAGRRGFSLLEIIVVIAILSVLVLLTVPAVEQMLKSSQITIAGRAVVDELSLAQQSALSRNSPVEVRILRLPASEDQTGGALASYRALQLYANGRNGQIPLGKIVFLPPGIIFEPDESKSSIFKQVNGPISDTTIYRGTVSIPKYELNYEYVQFRFRSNGETDMNECPAFFTLIAQKDRKLANGLPANFLTVQIDPVNGRTRLFRP